MDSDSDGDDTCTTSASGLFLNSEDSQSASYFFFEIICLLVVKFHQQTILIIFCIVNNVFISFIWPHFSLEIDPITEPQLASLSLHEAVICPLTKVSVYFYFNTAQGISITGSCLLSLVPDPEACL